MTAPTKRVPYDESLRLPLIVRWDGHAPANHISTALVGNIDIAPTLAALAGVRVPTPTDGVSFAPLVRQPSLPTVRHSLLLEQAASQSVPTDRVYTPNYCGLRTPGYTFVHYADGEEELYNDGKDPYQLTNLAHSAIWHSVLDNLRGTTRTLCTPTPPDFSWNG
jgi:N-acetylglucosamine-6-sulfatase